MEELKKNGVEITASYYCPHHPNAIVEKYRIDCNCRKPKTGLFEKAIKDFEIDATASWAIGDRMRDLSICEKSAIRGMLLYCEEETSEKNIFCIKGSLKEAAKKIIEEVEK